MQKTWVQSLGWEDPLEEGMATHSSIRAWRIPTDRGAWQVTVRGVAKSRTPLNVFTFTFHGSHGKESACSAGDLDSIPGSGRSPGEGNGIPLQYSCLENFTDRGAGRGYSPWAQKESDMTKQLTL